MKRMFFCLLILSLFISCASLSITGKDVTVSTLYGDTFSGIELVGFSSMAGSNSIKLAKTNTGQFVIYANVLTYRNDTVGSLILFADGERFNIIDYPQNWNISNVRIQSGAAPRVNEWNGHNFVSENVINSILNANTLRLRVVNGSLGLDYSDLDDVDLTGILPKIKTFLGS